MKFTAGELQGFSRTQSESLQDTCTIDRYSASYNSYGEPVISYVTSSGILCGVNMTGGRESYKDQMIVTNSDLVLRLPMDTLIDKKDRVTITKRYGVAVSGIQYQVISDPRKGVSGIQVDLSRIVI